MAATYTVEMGEVRVAGARDERLMAVGLGACIGLCLYDPLLRLGAMAHIVLPQTPHAPPLLRGQPLAAMPGKCADTAISFLIAQAVAQGARVSRLRAAMAGGAQIFSHSSQSSLETDASGGGMALSRLEIGPRNAEAVRCALSDAGIVLVAEETGGSCGRTVTFSIASGDFAVRRIGAQEHTLACLGGSQPAAAEERALAYGT